MRVHRRAGWWRGCRHSIIRAVSAQVEAHQVTKTYTSRAERVAAVRSVDLQIEQNTFVALMGASGSGKSTLLHLMAGLDVPTSGTILVEGDDLGAMSDTDRTLFRRRRIGVVFQSFNLLPTLTAVENVSVPLLIDGQPDREAHDRAMAALDLVDLSQRAQHRPDAMSGGEQQRVAIARSLIQNPALILADEPTGNLDSHHAREIWQLMRGLVDEQDRTIVAVTHEAFGASFADRVVVISDGQIVGEITPSDEDGPAGVAERYQALSTDTE